MRGERTERRELALAIVAGIDEAGFGPLLGPLVVSGVAFRVPDDQVNRCLWDVLSRSCSQRPGRGERRLVIADSKVLHRSGGLTSLERPVLVLFSLLGQTPATLRALLQTIAPDFVDMLQQYPWYAHAEVNLPVSEDLLDVGTRANALRVNCRDNGIEPVGAYAEPLPEGHYNQIVGRTRNKSVLLLGQALRVADRILRAAPHERVRLHVDRLGWRVHYRDALTTALPGHDIEILEESPARSAYRLTAGVRIIEIEFVTRGDATRFPVAYASLVGKYVREVCMHLFNQYWCAQQPGLKKTAGYYTRCPPLAGGCGADASTAWACGKIGLYASVKCLSRQAD